MAAIRNVSLIKRFTDYFKLKVGDMLDGEVTPLIVPVVSLPVPPNIFQVSDVVLNDSDKVITVPVGKQWKVLSISCVLITTAEVGGRRIQLSLRDSSNNNLWNILALNVQTASTTEIYNFQTGGVSVTEDFAARHLIPIPLNTILPENFSIRIFDNAAIDAAADDLTIRLMVEETDLTSE